MSDAFTIKEIRSLLEMLEKHEVTEFQIERGEERIWLKRGGEEEASQETQQLQQAPSPIQQVFSSMPTSVGADSGFIPSGPAQPAASAQGVSEVSSASSSNTNSIAVEAGETSAEVEAVTKPRREITSPMVGTFYRRPAVDAEPYVEVGDTVKRGDVLCIVEAMKLMNEIEADVSGTVAEVCLDDGQMVEYGEVLFRVEPHQ